MGLKSGLTSHVRLHPAPGAALRASGHVQHVRCGMKPLNTRLSHMRPVGAKGGVWSALRASSLLDGLKPYFWTLIPERPGGSIGGHLPRSATAAERWGEGSRAAPHLAPPGGAGPRWPPRSEPPADIGFRVQTARLKRRSQGLGFGHLRILRLQAVQGPRWPPRSQPPADVGFGAQKSRLRDLVTGFSV